MVKSASKFQLLVHSPLSQTPAHLQRKLQLAAMSWFILFSYVNLDLYTHKKHLKRPELLVVDLGPVRAVCVLKEEPRLSVVKSSMVPRHHL